MKHYLVTGGAGFIGSHVVDLLIAKGHSVVVVDDFSAGKKENLEQHSGNPNLTIITQSVCEDLSAVFASHTFDAIFHLAAIPGVQFSIDFPVQAHHANVNGTIYLLEMARKHNVERFIFTSSCAIYGTPETLPVSETATPSPLSPYAMHKLMGEQYCELYQQLYGLKTVMLRYFNVYGPRQNPEGGYASLIPKFLTMVNRGERPPIHGDGKQTRDFVYVTDVAEANYIAAETSDESVFGKAYNIGTGEELSVNDITWQIGELNNRKLNPVHGPTVVEARNVYADICKARDFLDWEPSVTFTQGLLDTYNFFKK